MNDGTKPTDAQNLRELALARSLTADEREELRLTELLEKLPPAPAVASNFTAQVLQKIAAEKRTVPTRSFLQRFSGVRFNWWPQAAAAALLVALGGLILEHQHLNQQANLARNVTEMSVAVSASDVQLMEDYEPIRRMSQSQQPKADVELLALFK